MLLRMYTHHICIPHIHYIVNLIPQHTQLLLCASLSLCHLCCSYLDAIERALSNGDCVLIENMGEAIDAVLDPLVGRNTIKKGRQVVTQYLCKLLCSLCV